MIRMFGFGANNGQWMTEGEITNYVVLTDGGWGVVNAHRRSISQPHNRITPRLRECTRPMLINQ